MPTCQNTHNHRYNLVWQKLLGLSGPFPYDDVVTKKEVPFYLAQANGTCDRVGELSSAGACVGNGARVYARY